MSDTRRAVSDDPNWGPRTPDFEKRYPGMTRKHQTQDRPPTTLRGGKRGKFVNRGKNVRYNLERKIEELQLIEDLELECVTCRRVQRPANPVEQ